jgi:hypothetical protein
LEIALVSAQDTCTVCAERTTALEIFWTHPMVLLGDEGQEKLVLVHLEIVLISAQDRCRFVLNVPWA